MIGAIGVPWTMNILLACAAEVEGAQVEVRFPRQTVVIGVGKAKAAAYLTARCLDRRPDAVVLFGVCGAYPRDHGGGEPPVDVGEVVLVEEDGFGDEGVAIDDGFLTVEDLGLGSNAPFVADAALLSRARTALPWAPAVRGTTVSTCSGCDAQSRLMASRTQAHVESMEGAAVALVCAELGIPWLQVRCVSNRTGNRDAGGWDLTGATHRIYQAVGTLMEVMAR